MSLNDIAKQDLIFITQNAGGFGRDITLTAPDLTVLQTRGLATKHHNAYDEDGMNVSSKIASVAISEEQFVGYPCRNANLEFNFEGHNVEVKDSTESDKKYRVIEWFPDENLGLVVLKLADRL